MRALALVLLLFGCSGDDERVPVVDAAPSAPDAAVSCGALPAGVNFECPPPAPCWMTCPPTCAPPAACIDDVCARCEAGTWQLSSLHCQCPDAGPLGGVATPPG